MNILNRNVPSARCAWLAAVLLASSQLHAQSRQVPAGRQSAPTVIVNGTLHNPPPERSGRDEVVVEDAWIMFEDGRITQVGTGEMEIPDGCEVLDAEGLHIYPGLIAGPTQLGLIETEQVRATDDTTELDSEHPEIQAWVAINPDSDLIPVARSSGIMSAVVFPGGGIISGQPSMIRLDGWTTEDLTIRESLGVIVNWPMMNPVTSRFVRRSASDQKKRSAERVKRIDTYFDDAEDWLKAREADPSIPWNTRYAALSGVISGEVPVYLDASRPSQIESGVAWAKGRGYRVVIVGGAGSGSCARMLAEEDVPVMLKGTHRLPLARHHAHDEIYGTPERLREAGVLFSIGNSESGAFAPAQERDLAHQAASAAAHGLPAGAALRSVTLSPAEIAGVGDELGSIETGKSATLIVTTGNPLELTSEVLVAYVDGRRIDLSDRQKMLAEKYREKYQQIEDERQP
ncbi:MAG: amidohydrolase family protein [Planctomycetota bacterium]|nr:amidohydrolase family protein [Planctomycetota bacterium]MEC9233556.1 amidohydrolase family protein [Planctomycetota bacterium]MED5506910.1 amidohydrolase family protein [Planctomycetota bacterium]MED6307835.1 amidohydrolase family protein [Planctomycetota bacterium]